MLRRGWDLCPALCKAGPSLEPGRGVPCCTERPVPLLPKLWGPLGPSKSPHPHLPPQGFVLFKLRRPWARGWGLLSPRARSSGREEGVCMCVWLLPRNLGCMGCPRHPSPMSLAHSQVQHRWGGAKSVALIGRTGASTGKSHREALSPLGSLQRRWEQGTPVLCYRAVLVVSVWPWVLGSDFR